MPTECDRVKDYIENHMILKYRFRKTSCVGITRSFIFSYSL